MKDRIQIHFDNNNTDIITGNHGRWCDHHQKERRKKKLEGYGF